MFEGKRFLPETGTPIWRMARVRVVLAVWLPEPFTVATWIEKSFVVAFNGSPNVPFGSWEPWILLSPRTRVKLFSPIMLWNRALGPGHPNGSAGPYDFDAGPNGLTPVNSGPDNGGLWVSERYLNRISPWRTRLSRSASAPRRWRSGGGPSSW